MEKRKCDLCSASFPRNELANFYSDGDCGGEEQLYCPQCARVVSTFMAFDAEKAGVDAECGACQACTPGGSRSKVVAISTIMSDDLVRQ